MTRNSIFRPKTAGRANARLRAFVTNTLAFNAIVKKQLTLQRCLLCLCCLALSLAAASTARAQTKWRAATEKELAALIPARAPVEKEQIETELRTAAGVTDGKGKFIAGVVIITAGYAAEGKYSHFFIAQTSLRVGELALPAGEYVFGYKRVDGEMLEVRFFEAATGKPLGLVNAHLQPARGPIRSLLINPPVGGKGTMLLGRFVFNYALNKP
ncbi:MAG: hypothetical protein HYR56_07995 [Acidobacteria bacterium]|nr:hypothetical protein [Acidobacteriota bacterium]MBI3425508.1 hypothetical protein [Acidobacteriota bacterium]